MNINNTPFATEAVRIVGELETKCGWSGTLQVRCGNQVLVHHAAGLANRSDQVPNSPSTRFQVASGCKLFTAILILELISEGKLAYETRLVDCLDVPFEHFDKGVTIGQLLAHTSGIPDYFDESAGGEYEDLWRTRPMYTMETAADFLPLFQSEGQTFPPGSRFQYNNAGYIVLGLVVEKLRKQAFNDCVQTRVFEPAGMADSGYFPFDQLPARTATAYINNDDGSWRTNIYSVPKIGGPDGGAFTTADDMARCWEAIEGGQFFSQDMRKTMMTPALHADAYGKGHRYGLGLWLPHGDDQAPDWYVCGWDPGVCFLSTRRVRDDLTVTILTNGNYSYWQLYRALMAAYESV